MAIRATRRRFLSALGLAGLGLGATAPAGAAQAGATTAKGQTVPFFGPHQAGIATPTQDYVEFLALDVVSDVLSDLRALMTSLSDAAARMTRGQPVGPLQTGISPPVDTGEQVGLSPSRLSITFGFGPAIFNPGRFGLSSKRPGPLVRLPAFPNDALKSAYSGGDIGIQICADDPQVAFHALHDLIRLASPTALPRWSLSGFGKTSNSRTQQTPRNLMGFKDGTANIMSEDTAALNRFVWAGAPESPAWMTGGSYMVVRRIAMLFIHWDGIGFDAQERTFGRYKVSGAPLGEVHEHDPIRLNARKNGHLRIPADSHIRLASPAYSGGQRILRRGYSFTDGIDRNALTTAAGQLFICYQRDPRKQFIPIQRRLAQADALSAHIEHVGSAIFACPPGANPGEYVGQSLLG
jgi:deferrochelatase/peroxidase EfeB